MRSLEILLKRKRQLRAKGNGTKKKKKLKAKTLVLYRKYVRKLQKYLFLLITTVLLVKDSMSTDTWDA